MKCVSKGCRAAVQPPGGVAGLVFLLRKPGAPDLLCCPPTQPITMIIIIT